MNPYPKPEKREKNKPTRIKPRNAKRAKQERQYLQHDRKEYLAENPFCKFNGCGREATEIHHMRGRLGAMLNNKKWFLGLCNEHHRYVELNPNFAKANGYSKSRLAPLNK
jgi:hypothetical protein